ncbi:hypothetical protein P700755_001890 [Psychroflexus torquis ATCC 700755]|uniref:Secretion system C-terminal sorting domain-containing protein n=1 Tax=Psychroflexus torquis (strain ATCC 700755 / CIP 106069 / ACAM 623) TaxID=313595 RepID=K4ITA6_PSYTT|nr:T9SS type A sorting domain-containing protein [Psychroflexus torquis]AFU68715.1 hypothetical protein P700755_001890 [Psychroflexus torquis ATCC 700755]
MKKITLSLMGLLAFGVSNAQQELVTVATGQTGPQVVSDAVLYDQQPGGTSGIVNLYSNDDESGVFATDDFELTTASDIGKITVYGFNNGGNAVIDITGINVYIYSNIEGINIPSGDPTQPGSGIVEVVDFELGGDGFEVVTGEGGALNLVVDIPVLTGEVVTLDAGFYWIVVTPSMNNLSGYPADSRFNQYGAGVGEGFGANDAHLIDPADQFGGGFTSWTSYVALGLEFFSTAFTIEGEENLSLYSNVKEAVSVYPNPAVDIINLQMPSVLTVNSAVIYNMIGQEINVSVINNQINVSNLSQGVHILKLETNQGTISRKFLKK